jgi:hypothetical protein
MRRAMHLVSLAVVVVLALVLGAAGQSDTPMARPSWRQVLAEHLHQYGAHNWIVVADSAYPDHARDGIETVVIDADQVEVLQTLLAMIDSHKHLRASACVDAELKSVADTDAPGIANYRDRLARVLERRTVSTLPHEQAVTRIDKVGQTYRVLVLKTSSVLPYSTVYLELDAGYWSPEAERRLRDAMR